MLIAGIDEPPIQHHAVQIVAKPTLAVAAKAEIKIPADAMIADTTNKMMMSGLSDTHV
jgi:hypothetical protein